MLHDHCDRDCDNCDNREDCIKEREAIRDGMIQKLKEMFPSISKRLIETAIDEVIDCNSEREAVERLERINKEFKRKEQSEKAEKEDNERKFSLNNISSIFSKNSMLKNPNVSVEPIFCPPDLPAKEVREAIDAAIKSVQDKYQPWRSEFFNYHKQHAEEIFDAANDRFSVDRENFKTWATDLAEKIMEGVGEGPEKFQFSEEDIGKFMTDILIEKKIEEKSFFALSEQIDSLAKNGEYEEASILLEQFHWTREHRKSDLLKTTMLKLVDLWEIASSNQLGKEFDRSERTDEIARPISKEDIDKFNVDDLLDNL